VVSLPLLFQYFSFHLSAFIPLQYFSISAFSFPPSALSSDPLRSRSPDLATPRTLSHAERAGRPSFVLSVRNCGPD
jgi:hypothetical protein